MKRIIIISACVVMLAALGFAAWRMYSAKQQEKTVSSTEIPVKWYEVGYDRDGEPISIEPLSRVEFIPTAGNDVNKTLTTKNLDSNHPADSSHDSVKNATSAVFNLSFDDILKSLAMTKTGNLLVADAAKTTNVNAKLDDTIFVYIKEPKDSNILKGYLYSIDGDKKLRFYIYTATSTGNQTITFEHPNGDIKAEPIVVNVTVTK